MMSMGALRAATAGLVCLAGIPGTAGAQDLGAGLPTSDQKTCLVRDANGRNKTGEKPQVPSTAGDQTDLQSRGYRAVPCAMSAIDMVKFREQVCRVAALNDPVISARFEVLYAVRPERMCRSVSAHLTLP